MTRLQDVGQQGREKEKKKRRENNVANVTFRKYDRVHNGVRFWCSRSSYDQVLRDDRMIVSLQAQVRECWTVIVVV